MWQLCYPRPNHIVTFSVIHVAADDGHNRLGIGVTDAVSQDGFIRFARLNVILIRLLRSCILVPNLLEQMIVDKMMSH